jgi:hypothetical protein
MPGMIGEIPRIALSFRRLLPLTASAFAIARDLSTPTRWRLTAAMDDFRLCGSVGPRDARNCDGAVVRQMLATPAMRVSETTHPAPTTVSGWTRLRCQPAADRAPRRSLRREPALRSAYTGTAITEEVLGRGASGRGEHEEHNRDGGRHESATADVCARATSSAARLGRARAAVGGAGGCDDDLAAVVEPEGGGVAATVRIDPLVAAAVK